MELGLDGVITKDLWGSDFQAQMWSSGGHWKSGERPFQEAHAKALKQQLCETGLIGILNCISWKTTEIENALSCFLSIR
jgi:hypothetical protein